MRRSLCPSVLMRKRPLDLDSIDVDSKRKSSVQARQALRQLNIKLESDEQNDGDVEQKLDPYSGVSHEEKIKAILQKPFVCPVIGYEASGRRRSLGARLAARTSLHDHEEEGALVLYSPPELSETEKMHASKTNAPVHVVVDPILSKILRPHQREGVKFMYDCVTGVQIPDSFGCVMADEMGLGKTLQCITLLWTLLTQGPNVNPVIEKAIIVAPSSLVKNWGNEILKWLKNAYPRPPNAMICEGGKEVVKDLKSFMAAQGRKICNPVLIISYDSLRLHKDILQSSEIGIVICDEGHKLKNKDNLIYAALNDLNCKRRVLLSGTPIQNDLLEYFSLIHFVNQGILGTVPEFKKKFENPILRGRDGGCTDSEMEKGRQRQQELIEIVKKCMIRRTSDILSKYLPTKHDFIICVNFTPLQLNLYKSFINSKLIKAVADGESGIKVKKGENESLKAIMFLKKLCNHPNLIQEVLQDYASVPTPPELQQKSKTIVPAWSGKMMFLDTLLAHIKSTTNDRVVLISNYTQTLDLFQDLCRLRNYNYVRLDGSMTVKKRSKIVDSFNDPASKDFVFMLSSKAGGCGLNLIGANRLVMFDPDWNPANDSQAMARCWRDGQKKECYTYRLLATGSIEEKIFQRQTHKKALSSTLVDEAEVDRHFTLSELKELFRLEEGHSSHTHAQLKCKRCFSGTQATPPPQTADCNSDLKDWHHCHDKRLLSDVMLKYAWETGVSFAFYQKSHEQRKTV